MPAAELTPDRGQEGSKRPFIRSRRSVRSH